MELPPGLSARQVSMTARQMTYEVTLDVPAYQEALIMHAVYSWVQDPALAGYCATQLTCQVCTRTVLVAGYTAPVRWVCACGQEQAATPALIEPEPT